MADLLPDEVVSTRLRMVPLPIGAFEALAEGDAAAASRLAGSVLPEGWPREYPWRMWADALAGDPARHPWSARAAIARGSGAVVGNVGFHGPPGDGVVEVGYTIEAQHRRQGYAVEAVGAMLTWASHHPDVTKLRAATAPDNVASQRVLRRLGFTADGTQIDEVDGLELVFVRPAFAD